MTVQLETSRICPVDRPRWTILGSEASLVKFGVDPQEEALRRGDLDSASEPSEHRARIARPSPAGTTWEPFETRRGSWDSYYANIAAHLARGEPLAVTAEQASEVVRLLEAATTSARAGTSVEGPWGTVD